jgi:DMSO/TMAO reductase YedYZ molybdopterin-dependent catalytic subunit/cytochrome c553
MPTPPNSRRYFLRNLGLGGGAVMLASCAKGGLGLTNGERSENLPAAPPILPEPAVKKLPDGLSRNNFYVHNEKPLALETKRQNIGSSPITPTSVLFVRNNLPMPSKTIVSNPDEWVLEVKGVKSEQALTVAKLKTMGRSFETSVLQCSGNGRAFFEHGPSGSQWAVGAAGCVIWCGVRVSEVIQQLGGAATDFKFLTGTGGETLPENLDAKIAVVERSVPAGKGLKDCLLAWEMNGEPIPITHGGPLRLVVPGYFGCNNIKYIKTLTLSDKESESKIQQKGYRFRPLGEKGNPDQPSLWRMPVKSWVNGPGADDTPTLSGKVHFHGVAFSGERGVNGIEVSMDKGKSWVNAEFDGPSMGPNAWRAFHFAVELEEGEYSIVSRAKDTEGDVQPAFREENERGYAYNAWQEAALNVRVVDILPQSSEKADARDSAPVVLSKKQVRLSESGERGKAVFTQTAQPGCGVCHTLSDAEANGTIGPNLDSLKPAVAQTENAVINGVGVMPSFGDSLSPDQISDLAQYIKEASH